jgi:hypothetical protein
MGSFGREICGDVASAEQREWLVTNGLGGYVSGTLAGLLTRRYYGLLVASLPPLQGRMLLTKLDETASCPSRRHRPGLERGRGTACLARNGIRRGGR